MPLGLVHSSIGGTTIQQWMPPATVGNSTCTDNNCGFMEQLPPRSPAQPRTEAECANASLVSVWGCPSGTCSDLYRGMVAPFVNTTIAGAISMLAQFGMFFGGNRNNNGPGIIGSIAMMILAPLGAMLVQMAISRTREYAADNYGARIVGQPMWLASALAKIENSAHHVPNMEAERNPATAHMFIINPLSGHGVDNLFATHPSTANRIAALQQLAAEPGTQTAPRPAGGATRAGAGRAAGARGRRGEARHRRRCGRPRARAEPARRCREARAGKARAGQCRGDGAPQVFWGGPAEGALRGRAPAGLRLLGKRVRL